jgi:hypothetical protein
MDFSNVQKQIAPWTQYQMLLFSFPELFGLASFRLCELVSTQLIDRTGQPWQIVFRPENLIIYLWDWDVYPLHLERYTVSVGYVLKWRASSPRHVVNSAENVVDEHHTKINNITTRRRQQQLKWPKCTSQGWFLQKPSHSEAIGGGFRIKSHVGHNCRICRLAFSSETTNKLKQTSENWDVGLGLGKKVAPPCLLNIGHQYPVHLL